MNDQIPTISTLRTQTHFAERAATSGRACVSSGRGYSCEVVTWYFKNPIDAADELMGCVTRGLARCHAAVHERIPIAQWQQRGMDLYRRNIGRSGAPTTTSAMAGMWPRRGPHVIPARGDARQLEQANTNWGAAHPNQTQERHSMRSTNFATYARIDDQSEHAAKEIAASSDGPQRRQMPATSEKTLADIEA